MDSAGTAPPAARPRRLHGHGAQIWFPRSNRDRVSSHAEPAAGTEVLLKEGEVSEFSREEVEQAFRRRIAIQERDDWPAYVETFTDDAVYVEHHEGTFCGKEEIRAWLLPVMEQCKGWTYPLVWVAIDGARVVYKWLNRLPGRRSDGTYYEFAGMTALEYAGGGLWRHQEDVYNWERAVEVLREWRQASGDRR